MLRRGTTFCCQQSPIAYPIRTPSSSIVKYVFELKSIFLPQHFKSILPRVLHIYSSSHIQCLCYLVHSTYILPCRFYICSTENNPCLPYPGHTTPVLSNTSRVYCILIAKVIALSAKSYQKPKFAHRARTKYIENYSAWPYDRADDEWNVSWWKFGKLVWIYMYHSWKIRYLVSSPWSVREIPCYHRGTVEDRFDNLPFITLVSNFSW